MGGEEAATGAEFAALPRPRLRVGEGEDYSISISAQRLYHCEGRREGACW